MPWHWMGKVTLTFTGLTGSPDFPTTLGAFQTICGGSGPACGVDAFVTKLNATGSGLIYSTYLGGSDFEVAGGIKVDPMGNAYVTGETFSIDFPTANPLQVANAGNGDLFVTKLNPTGSGLVYSTYLGGSSLDMVASTIAIDRAGSAYVVGFNSSTELPSDLASVPTWVWRRQHRLRSSEDQPCQCPGYQPHPAGPLVWQPTSRHNQLSTNGHAA